MAGYRHLAWVQVLEGECVVLLENYQCHLESTGNLNLQPGVQFLLAWKPVDLQSWNHTNTKKLVS